jgi:hypothetical protein
MYNKGPDYDGNGAKPIQAQPYGTGIGVTNVQPIIVNNAQGQQSFVPQAQPTFNAMGNNNNNNGSPMCTMVKEDLMKIITDSGYGQTNPAMFNMYFQQGSSPPLCLGCMRPLQSHPSRQQTNSSLNNMPMMMPDQQAGMQAIMNMAMNQHQATMNNLGVSSMMPGGLSPDALPTGVIRNGSVDGGTVGTNKVQSILGCIFLPIGFMILIIFTAVGLYDSKMGGVFVIQPAIFITIGLCFTFIPNKTRVSFDRNTRTYTIETSKYWYPCLGKKVYNGSFDEIKNASSVNSGCSQNKQPQYLIKLHLASGESINVGTCNWFLSNARVVEWNNYINNTLHQPKA